MVLAGIRGLRGAGGRAQAVAPAASDNALIVVTALLTRGILSRRCNREKSRHAFVRFASSRGAAAGQSGTGSAGSGQKTRER